MSGEVDLDRILEDYRSKGLNEVVEKVGEWAFHISDLPVQLKIKVDRVMPQGQYMGIANYRIQNPKQETPYMNICLCDTIDEALDDALRGFMTFWPPEEYKDKTKFVPVEDW